MPEHWKPRGTPVVADHGIFRVSQQPFESPRNGNVVDAVVLHAPDWVNIVAFTHERRCVLIHQYRFGTGKVTLEIPGGIVDPGESPLTAAVRELREETGYHAERWTSLGSIAPNPAFQNNRLHTFLAEEASWVGAQEQDETEDIAVELIPEADI
ncbi:MAG: NUDIX hydrolase, partial [Polyangiales bacterium]